MDQYETNIAQLKTDLAFLKDFAVFKATQRRLGIIAKTANVHRPRWLNSTEVIDIAEDAEDEGRADDIPEGEIRSFKAIDLAIAATDKTTRQPCYVVIECSYTVTKSDADRARRNAGHMTRFTGVPAKAIIAGSVVPDQVSAYAKDIDVSFVLVTPKVSAAE